MNYSKELKEPTEMASVLISAATTLLIALLFALPAILWTGCAPNAEADEKRPSTTATQTEASEPVPAHDEKTHEEIVKRGEYMVTIGGCNDCHTPFKMGPKGPEPDMSRMLSGHPETLVLPDEPSMSKGWDGMVAA